LEDGENGNPITNAQITEGANAEKNKTGLYALEKADIFNILCIPPYSKTKDIEDATYEAAMTYCQKRRAVLLIDSPSDWNTTQDAITGLDDFDKHNYAAMYFPRLFKPNPLKNNQIEAFV